MKDHKQVIQKRKERERNQRINSILNAAKKVFFSNGYAKSTMDEIAYEAEISKPTIYKYFKNKDTLFYELMIPVIRNIYDQLQKLEIKLVEKKIKTGTDFVNALINTHCDCYNLEPDTFRIILLFQQGGLIGQFSHEIRDILYDTGKKNFSMGRRIIQMAIDQGLIKQYSVFQLMDIVWGLFTGLIQLDGIKTEYQPSKNHFDETLDLAKIILSNALSTGK